MATAAEILCQRMIDVGILADPTAAPAPGAFLGVVGVLPDMERAPDNMVGFLDTGGAQTDRLLRYGVRPNKPAVSVTVRARGYGEATAKGAEIQLEFDRIGVAVTDGGAGWVPVSVGPEDWSLRGVHTATPLTFVAETEKNQRQLFSINVRVEAVKVAPGDPAASYMNAVPDTDDFLFGYHGGNAALFAIQAVAAAMGLLATSGTPTDGDLLVFDSGVGTWRPAKWRTAAPAGAVNGVNTAFVLPSVPKPASSLTLFLNGLALTAGAGNDYTVAGAAVTMAVAPSAGDVLTAEFLT